jgi:hypothetical protein
MAAQAGKMPKLKLRTGRDAARDTEEEEEEDESGAGGDMELISSYAHQVQSRNNDGADTEVGGYFGRGPEPLIGIEQSSNMTFISVAMKIVHKQMRKRFKGPLLAALQDYGCLSPFPCNFNGEPDFVMFPDLTNASTFYEQFDHASYTYQGETYSRAVHVVYNSCWVNLEDLNQLDYAPILRFFIPSRQIDDHMIPFALYASSAVMEKLDVLQSDPTICQVQFTNPHGHHAEYEAHFVAQLAQVTQHGNNVLGSGDYEVEQRMTRVFTVKHLRGSWQSYFHTAAPMKHLYSTLILRIQDKQNAGVNSMQTQAGRVIRGRARERILGYLDAGFNAKSKGEFIHNTLKNALADAAGVNLSKLKYKGGCFDTNGMFTYWVKEFGIAVKSTLVKLGAAFHINISTQVMDAVDAGCKFALKYAKFLVPILALFFGKLVAGAFLSYATLIVAVLLAIAVVKWNAICSLFSQLDRFSGLFPAPVKKAWNYLGGKFRNMKRDKSDPKVSLMDFLTKTFTRKGMDAEQNVSNLEWAQVGITIPYVDKQDSDTIMQNFIPRPGCKMHVPTAVYDDYDIPKKQSKGVKPIYQLLPGATYPVSQHVDSQLNRVYGMRCRGMRQIGKMSKAGVVAWRKWLNAKSLSDMYEFAPTLKRSEIPSLGAYLCSRKAWPFAKKERVRNAPDPNLETYHGNTFVKAELLTKPPTKAPRIVTACEATIKKRFGPIYWAVGKSMARMFVTASISNPRNILYGSGKNRNENGHMMYVSVQRYVDSGYTPIYTTLDAKKFDSQQGPDLLGPFLSVLGEHMLPGHIDVQAHAALIAGKKTTNGTEFGKGKGERRIRFKLHGTRASGDVDTTVSNTLLSISLDQFNKEDKLPKKTLRKFQHLMTSAHSGDDVIQVNPECVAAELYYKEDSFSNYDMLGIPMRHDSTDVLSRATTCQSCYIRCNKGNGEPTMLLSALPGRLFVKTPKKCISPQSTAREKAALAAEKCTAMANEMMLPGMKSFYRGNASYYKTLAKGYRLSETTDVHAAYKMKIGASVFINEYTYLDFADRYDIHVDEMVALDRWFSNLRIGQHIALEKHPGFRSIKNAFVAIIIKDCGGYTDNEYDEFIRYNAPKAYVNAARKLYKTPNTPEVVPKAIQQELKASTLDKPCDDEAGQDLNDNVAKDRCLPVKYNGIQRKKKRGQRMWGSLKAGANKLRLKLPGASRSRSSSEPTNKQTKATLKEINSMPVPMDISSDDEDDDNGL